MDVYWITPHTDSGLTKSDQAAIDRGALAEHVKRHNSLLKTIHHSTTQTPIANMSGANGNGELSDGFNSYTSRNGEWKIVTRKAPILKAGPIDELNEKLGIPIPEMIFGDNFVAIQHLKSGWTLNFNASDALDRVSKTADGMLQVAYSKEWQRDRCAKSLYARRGLRVDMSQAASS